MLSQSGPVRGSRRTFQLRVSKVGRLGGRKPLTAHVALTAALRLRRYPIDGPIDAKLSLMSPLPRRRRIRFAPQPRAVCLSPKLSLLVSSSLRWSLLSLVLLVPPRHASLDLFQIHILAVDEDNADLAFVEIDLAAVQGDVFVKDHSGQVGLRLVPERLTGLRCIDPSKADLVLSLGAIEDGNGIAIMNAHDPALNGLS